jgi:hypothetical protein
MALKIETGFDTYSLLLAPDLTYRPRFYLFFLFHPSTGSIFWIGFSAGPT